MAEIPDSYAAFNCKVNSIPVDDLFRTYHELGFLYPEKSRRLEPFLPLVCENWKRAMRGGELIMYVVSTQLENGEQASITSWRNTNHGWNTQHLAGNNPVATRSVLLSTQAVRIKDQLDTSHQSWFQRKNRFANKVFGSIVETLGPATGWVSDYRHYHVPLSLLPSISLTAGVHIRNAKPSDTSDLHKFAVEFRSSVYATAEELSGADLFLEGVDDLYRRVGLTRFRRIFIAETTDANEPSAIAIAYRGPLGMNFSFLENRCDILVNPNVNSSYRNSSIIALIRAAGEAYANFPPQVIPIVIDRQHCDCDILRKSEYIRDYAQSVWLADGFPDWYHHVDAIYERFCQRIASVR